jgi:hypothetical protein
LLVIATKVDFAIPSNNTKSDVFSLGSIAGTSSNVLIYFVFHYLYEIQLELSIANANSIHGFYGANNGFQIRC